MKENKKGYCLVVSDVIEPGQEEAVIEAIKKYVKRDQEELKDYFKATDTIEIDGLTKSEAVELRNTLARVNVSLDLRASVTGAGGSEPSFVRCPQCGTKLESLDWRCPECYYEFPDYEYRDEGE